MKSPFPGMDPYIEACGLWEDFHHSLVEQIKLALLASIPRGFIVRSGERAYVVLAEENGKTPHSFSADVGVTTSIRHPKEAGKPTAVAAASEIEAITIRSLVTESFRETFVEVYELKPEYRLVTCIEVLSPSNKRPNTEGWVQYERKRQALLLGSANLVEIDLLRGGQRMPMHDPWPASPYLVLVSRVEKAPYCRVWPASFQRPLPKLEVPLSPPHPDVPVDLQALVESIYDTSRYDEQIAYSRPLTPRLKKSEAGWARERLREWSRKK